MNRFEMSFVAFKQVALVVLGCGNKARRDDQVGIKSAHRTSSHDVFVEASAYAAVGAPRSNAFQAKNMGTTFKKAKLRAFIRRRLKTDAARFESGLFDAGHEQMPAEATRFVVLHAGLFKTAHHLPTPARPT